MAGWDAGRLPFSQPSTLPDTSIQRRADLRAPAGRPPALERSSHRRTIKVSRTRTKWSAQHT